MPLSFVSTESFPQAAGVSSDPIWVFLVEGSDVEDNLLIAGQLNRKMKASTNPTEARVQIGAVRDFPIVGEVLILPVPHHGLDVPRK